jgi:hypothetical protein
LDSPVHGGIDGHSGESEFRLIQLNFPGIPDLFMSLLTMFLLQKFLFGFLMECSGLADRGRGLKILLFGFYFLSFGDLLEAEIADPVPSVLRFF